MEWEDFFRDDKLSTWKLWTTATINRLLKSWDIDESIVSHFKDDLNMNEREIVEAVKNIIKVN